MKAQIRTFIAIELSERIRRGLARVQRQLEFPGLKVRWARVEVMHLTLKFLGSIRRDVVPEVSRLMREAVQDIEPFELTIEGLGSFPSSDRPRILWVGVGGELDPLRTLAERLEIGARKLGAKGEDRRYVPHMTLGRVKSAPPDFAERLASVEKPVLGTVQAQELILFMSELTRQGSAYTALDRIGFGA